MTEPTTRPTPLERPERDPSSPRRPGDPETTTPPPPPAAPPETADPDETEPQP
jgi:hypothetical protein